MSSLRWMYGQCAAPLPERAPPDVALAQIFNTGGLVDQLFHLFRKCSPLHFREVTEGQCSVLQWDKDTKGNTVYHGARKCKVPCTGMLPPERRMGWSGVGMS